MREVSLKYRLEALLLIKRKAKEKAEAALAKAITRQKEAEKKLEKLEGEKKEILRMQKECRLKLHEKVSSGSARVKDGHYRIHFLKKLEEDEKAKDREIEEQKRVVEECKTEVKRARRDYIDASRELQVMEKHKALWQKKLNLMLLRKEEGEMDELGNIIHQLRKVA